MRWIILAFVIFLFAYSVTLKYFERHAAFTPEARYGYVLVQRTALPLVMYMNAMHPDGVLFQNWYDEYRAWMNYKNVGRRQWEGSFREYKEQYPENTALDLWQWLRAYGVTHAMFNPTCEFELPTDDPLWPVLFKLEAYYREHSLYRVMTRLEDVPTINLADGQVVHHGEMVDNRMQE